MPTTQTIPLRQECLELLRALPSSVVIVTLRVDGRPWGVTVSSLIPVTLDPPKLLVSLFSDSMAATHIVRSGRFGVSLLTIDHAPIARAQARSRVPKFMESDCSESDLFQADEFGMAGSGSDLPGDHYEVWLPPPRVAGASHFDCRVAQTMAVDDHLVLVGEVTDVRPALTTQDPLLYVDGSFVTVSRPSSEL